MVLEEGKEIIIVSGGVMGITFFLCRLFLFVVEPLLLGGCLLIFLVNGAFYLGLGNGFIGLILFIVYVGGTMVLFTYCLMLSPLQFFSNQKKYYRIVLILRGGFLGMTLSMGIFEFYFVLGVLLIIGILLFLVMLRVVELVDFSRGSLRVG